MLTIQEIRQLQAKDLQEELSRSTRELMRTKMDLINGHSKESHQVKVLKRHIARLRTVQKEDQKEAPGTPRHSGAPMKQNREAATDQKAKKQ